MTFSSSNNWIGLEGTEEVIVSIIEINHKLTNIAQLLSINKFNRKRVGTPFSSPKAAKDRSSLDAKNKAGVDSSSSATGAGSISVSVNSKTDVVPSSSSIELTKSQTVPSSGSVVEPTSATTTSSTTGDSISSSHSRERKTNFDDKKKSSHERTGELSNASCMLIYSIQWILYCN